MARDGAGTYTFPVNSFNPAVAATDISPTDWNSTSADLATALSASLAKDGQTTTTAAIPFAAGIQGVTVASNASAGNVGEYISSDVASGAPVALTTVTAKTFTSISLTAGDWDVSLLNAFAFTGTTAAAGVIAGSISLTNNTVDFSLGRFAESLIAISVFTGNATVSIPSRRFSLAVTTTIYGVSFADFSGGTVGAYGNLSARRIR